MPKGYWKPFTPAQEDKLLNEYLTKPTKRLAEELNCSDQRVHRFAKKHGLKIPKEKIQEWKKSGQFKVGAVSFNKGLKQTEYMSKAAIEKSKKTRFKKGNLPANTKADNVVTIRRDTSARPYKYIRLSQGVWELHHRVVWERNNGKIPKDHIVVFKDGDSLNTDIKNLELISKAENMLRNSRHNYPEEIIPSMVLVNKLENQLKQLQDA